MPDRRRRSAWTGATVERMKALSPGERRWLAVSALCLLALTLAPIAVAAARTPPDQVFSGFVYEARDAVSYVGKAQEGAEGHWLYRDPYTSEAQPGALIYVPYIVAGQVARAVPLPVALWLHLWRLGLGAALLVAVYLLCRECFADVGWRRLAFALAFLGGGIGWITSHADILGYHYVSLDTGVSSLAGLETLSLGPHIVLTALGSAWLALLWVRHADHVRGRDLLAAAGWSLLVALAYPQMGALWMAVYAVLWLARRSRGTLALTVAVAVGAAPYILYGVWLRGHDPIFADWPPLHDIDVGDPLSYLVFGHLFMVPFVALAAAALWRDRAAAARSSLLVPAAWVLVSAVLMYAPGLPRVMERTFYASFIPFGILAAAGLGEAMQRVRSPAWRSRLAVYSVAAMSVLSLHTVVDGVAIPLLHRNDLALYFPADEARVLARLRDQRPGGGGLVMNSFLSGLYVPALSGQTTYVGFPFETLRAQDKQADAARLYRLTDPDQVRAEARRLGLDYLLWGRYERAFGGPDPGALAGWPEVARSGDARLYRVTR
jgi:hypothetical protein